MAQVQPSTSNAPPPATNGQPTPSTSNQQQIAPLSWEGDRMFNVYIHDYFLKRGFRKAAKELVLEAEIGNDASPPINARQGFLFEWWSVFWMFFSAKTTGQGPENVMLYFHWIQSQQAERSRQLQLENEQRRAAQLPLTTQPPPRALGRPPPVNAVRPPGMVNGTVPMPQAPGQAPPSGQPLPYPMGVQHPPMPSSHQQPPPAPGQPQPQLNGIVDPHNPQRPPSQQQQTRQGPHGPGGQPQPQPGQHPPPSHPNTVPHLQASSQPRQVSRGQHDAMRPPGQFQSPTMASAHPPGPGQQQPGSLAAHPHMGGAPAQMGAPGAQHLAQHQHLGRGPPPPQAGAQPNHPSPRNPSQTPTQPYQQLMNHGGPMGRPQGPGSRSATPGGNPLTQQSPALAAREPPPPQGQGQSVNEEMSRRFQQQHNQQQQPQPQQQSQPPPPQQQQRGGLQEQQEIANMESNIVRIPPVFLAQMKMEAGVGDRDISTLSYEEKARLNVVFKRTMDNYNGTTSATNPARNGRPGNQPMMSGMPTYMPHGPMGARPPPGQVQPGPGPSGQGQPGQGQPRGQKRSSTSPSDEQQAGDATPKDQSPPERKRPRRSPQNAPAHTPGGSEMSGAAPPIMNSMGGFPPNQQPGSYPGPPAPQQQQNMPMNPMRQLGGPMGMNGPPPGQTVPNPGGINFVGMGHPMPPGMAPMNPTLPNQQIMGHPLPNTQVGSSGRPPLPSPEISYPFQNQSQSLQQQMHYRQTIAAQHLHKMPTGIGANAGNPGNTNPSPSADTHDPARAGPGGAGGPGGNRQAPPGKPGSMMPPPSPAHRADNANAQKGSGMMPPPAQPGNAAGNSSGPAKEQTAPSPAGGRHEGPTGSSPSMRPTSSSGAPPGGSQQSGTPSMSQGSAGGPATPASTGGNNTSNNNTTAQSPSAILSNRISPSAAMNSLPRPQTSGPDATPVNNANNNAPPPSSSAPPSSAPSISNNLFTDFFDSMEENFGLDGAFSDTIDTAEFAQWIDMNPLS